MRTMAGIAVLFRRPRDRVRERAEFGSGGRICAQRTCRDDTGGNDNAQGQTHQGCRRTGRAAARAWTGADPSKGPGIERLRQLQREGQCVIDEGYGRYTYCSNQ